MTQMFADPHLIEMFKTTIVGIVKQYHDKHYFGF